jgi:hypothetical protein
MIWWYNKILNRRFDYKIISRLQHWQNFVFTKIQDENQPHIYVYQYATHRWCTRMPHWPLKLVCQVNVSEFAVVIVAERVHSFPANPYILISQRIKQYRIASAK